MLKILQARLQQYVNCELPEVQMDLENAEEPELKLSTSIGSSKKQEFQENIYFCFIDYASFDCVDHNKLENSERDGNTRSPDLPPEKSVCAGQETTELDMEQKTGSNSGKEYVKAVCCHHVYLTYMQSTSWEMFNWRKHKVESRFQGEISITSDMQMTPPWRQKAKKPLDESERGEWKNGLKTQHSKN